MLGIALKKLYRITFKKKLSCEGEVDEKDSCTSRKMNSVTKTTDQRQKENQLKRKNNLRGIFVRYTHELIITTDNKSEFSLQVEHVRSLDFHFSL